VNARTAIFALTVFVSSCLLFVVQPMMAKLVLPLLGGAPAVWNTCMVFFQVCLLLGYAYAHLTTRWLSVRMQAILHVLLLAAALVVLPLRIPGGWSPPASANPVGWLLLLLLVAVGLPFAIVSTTAPLLQRWFAHAESSRSQDAKKSEPYFLYAASNLGSMVALLSYPLLVEPSLHLNFQSRYWSIGYGVLIGLIASCALSASGGPRSGSSVPSSSHTLDRVRWTRRIRWIVLSMIPASYLLGVTTYITTDIAAVPLLWVLPLALYLLSFILVFSRRPMLRHHLMIALQPIAAILVVLWIVTEQTQPLWPILCVHLLAFFISAMVCHGELVRLRPPAEHLTDFYLMISIGGALGGMFNALAAPLIFRTPLEYPIVIVAACLLCPLRGTRLARTVRSLALDVIAPLVIGLSTFVLLRAVHKQTTEPTAAVLVLSLPLLVCMVFRRRPVRFGLSLGAALLASTLMLDPAAKILLTRRSFFGVHRLVQDRAGPVNELYHGTTLHGRQFLDPKSLQPWRPDEPLTYYHRSGPAGSIMRLAGARWDRPLTVGAVGLGTGSMAAYATPQSQWTFYEIDPIVLWLARDSGAFTYLSAARSRGVDEDFVLGDARLTIQNAPNHSFDLLILDAFSSDSIPVHLLTTEAFEIYLRKLRPGGWIALHISNQYLDLRPVVANIAQHFGLICVAGIDTDVQHQRAYPGKEGSVWLLLVPELSDAVPLAQDGRWTRLDPEPHIGLWSDDFSNVVSLLKWKP